MICKYADIARLMHKVADTRRSGFDAYGRPITYVDAQKNMTNGQRYSMPGAGPYAPFTNDPVGTMTSLSGRIVGGDFNKDTIRNMQKDKEAVVGLGEVNTDKYGNSYWSSTVGVGEYRKQNPYYVKLNNRMTQYDNDTHRAYKKEQYDKILAEKVEEMNNRRDPGRKMREAMANLRSRYENGEFGLGVSNYYEELRRVRALDPRSGFARWFNLNPYNKTFLGFRRPGSFDQAKWDADMLAARTQAHVDSTKQSKEYIKNLKDETDGRIVSPFSTNIVRHSEMGVRPGKNGLEVYEGLTRRKLPTIRIATDENGNKIYTMENKATGQMTRRDYENLLKTQSDKFKYELSRHIPILAYSNFDNELNQLFMTVHNLNSAGKLENLQDVEKLPQFQKLSDMMYKQILAENGGDVQAAQAELRKQRFWLAKTLGNF